MRKQANEKGLHLITIVTKKINNKPCKGKENINNQDTQKEPKELVIKLMFSFTSNEVNANLWGINYPA